MSRRTIRLPRTVALLSLLLLAVLPMCLTAPYLRAYVSRQRLVAAYEEGDYRLACEGVAREGTDVTHIFVFQSEYQGWPGENHQDIVLTDSSYRVLQSAKSAPESMFVSAAFHTAHDRPMVTIWRAIRPGLQVEIVSYECDGGTIREVSRVLDPPEVKIPADFRLRRPNP
jgi:hypothetical protein